MVYIIHPDVDLWNFVLSGELPFVTKRPLKQYTSKGQQLIRKLDCRGLALPGFLLGPVIRRELKALSSEDVLIVADYVDISLLIAIDHVVSERVKKYLWLWNPVKGALEKRLLRVKNIVHDRFTICTFDPNDAKRFGLELHTQFFRMDIEIQPLPVLYDFYFLGFDKGRQGILDEIKHRLQGYKCEFIVVHKLDDYIDYQDNLSNATRSRCLVEVVQDGQSGLTLRPLEAMALGKKLLTNNVSIKNSAVYDPNNIFIIGERSWEELPVFLRTPTNFSRQVKSVYDVQAWARSFIPTYSS